MQQAGTQDLRAYVDLPSARARPAAGPLDQPADLPAGERDPEAPPALSAQASAARAAAPRGPAASAGPARAAPSAYRPVRTPAALVNTCARSSGGDQRARAANIA